MLIVESGPETVHGDRYRQGVARMIGLGAQRIVLTGANHYSFTDVEFTLSRPAQWLLHRLIGGDRGAAATQFDAAVIIDDFLRKQSGRPPREETSVTHALSVALRA